MAVNETGPALRTIAFDRGEQRGTQLTIYPTCLVHRGEGYVETLPLATVTAVRVQFAREPRKLGWGVALVVLALLLLALAGPLGVFASGASNEMAASAQGVARALYGFFRFLEGVASALPLVALLCVIGGGALCAFGWLGSTVLFIGLSGGERVYATRGRDTGLLDFAETLSERLMLLKR